MNDTINPGTLNSALKCNGCGAQLYFTPGTRNLKCDHCGASNAIETDQNPLVIEAFDYDFFVAHIDQHKKSDEMKVVSCSNCGSEAILSSYTTSDKCSFCAAALVLSPQNGQQYVPPHYILPFELNSQQAIEHFDTWLKKRWWAPNDLTKKVKSSSWTLQGIYLPHWIFDTDTLTRYQGERGDYYYTTESYTTTVNGKTEERTRSVQHTRWTAVAGMVSCNFYELEVPASKSLPQKTLKELAPWKFDQLVKFDERYMSGFRSETYQVSPEEGFTIAIEQTKHQIRSKIENAIGGDKQSVDSTATDYFNKGIKYIMLPVWTSAYNYNNKIYQFTVNASTGEVIGSHPRSKTKIFLFIFILLVILANVITRLQK